MKTLITLLIFTFSMGSSNSNTLAKSSPSPEISGIFSLQPTVEVSLAQTRLDSPEVKTIAFYLQSGVEVLDFAGPMEVFSYAGYEVFTISKTREPILSQGILKVIPDYSIGNAPHADILAFFGGNGMNTASDPEVIDWVKKQKQIDYYFSVCTGAFILGEAGLLDGLSATTFHDALDNLEKRYPETAVLKNARFVDNGKVITTAGISAGIDGALHLVAKLQSVHAAQKVAYYMEYDKWTPGEGVILSDDNPYQNLPDLDNLHEYTGNYKFRNQQKIQFEIDSTSRCLQVKLNDRTYPLFYVEKDLFLDIDNEQVRFLRDDSKQITAYELPSENVVYSKLDP